MLFQQEDSDRLLLLLVLLLLLLVRLVSRVGNLSFDSVRRDRRPSKFVIPIEKIVLQIGGTRIFAVDGFSMVLCFSKIISVFFFIFSFNISICVSMSIYNVFD